MKLNELRDKIHENAKAKGFYNVENEVNQFGINNRTVIKHAFFAQKIALIHSEASEALEADRKRRYTPTNISLNGPDFGDWSTQKFEILIKNTVEDELSDVIIRVLDLCGYLGIDVEKHVELKMRYNESRGYKHGKDY
ncbi:MAG: hypothetical protein LBV26_06805 [Bacteroidales bacterium]|jgi:NTP pyrophosphatase (non-canonical NTP hydrolase)|nr:hypothetical protein [Bacteroidales bacterium]